MMLPDTGPPPSPLADFVSGLSAADTLETAFDVLSGSVVRLGFDAVAYTAIPTTLVPAGRLVPVFLASADFDRRFLAHYVEAGLERHDFTIERIRAGRLDTLDWSEERTHGRLSPGQVELVDLARVDYGLRNAISVPTLNDGHVIAGASVVTNERDAPFARLKRERLGTLSALVNLFHHCVFATPAFRGHFYSALLERFTAQERRVTRMIVGGHRLKSSPELCGLSPTRAGNVLSGLYAKFGVGNAGEFAHLVGLHGLVRLL